MAKNSRTILNLPNAITMGRIILVPIIIWALFASEFLLGFVLFALAGLSDFFDGWLARLQKTQTDFGAYLDPIADKLLMGSTYIVLGLLGHMPIWLISLVIVRDMLIVIGVVVLRRMGKDIHIKPILISKLNTLLLCFLVTLVLADLAFMLGLAELLNFTYLATAAITIASALAYLHLWVTIILKQSAD